MRSPDPLGWLILLGVSGAAIVVSQATTAEGHVRIPFMPATFAVLLLANLVLIALAVVHLWVRTDLNRRQRIVWTIVCAGIVPGLALGALAYFVLGDEETRAMFRDIRFPWRTSRPG